MRGIFIVHNLKVEIDLQGSEKKMLHRKYPTIVDILTGHPLLTSSNRKS